MVMREAAGEKVINLSTGECKSITLLIIIGRDMTDNELTQLFNNFNS